jgi:hypothetical protein
MEVAAAIVGCVGLSGQVLQGCNYLCNFFADASDAPGLIVTISAQLCAVRSGLQAFQLLLLEVQTIPPASLTLQQDPAVPLKLCQDAVQSLQTFVNKYADLSVSTQPKSAGAQARKLWHKLDVARRGAQLKTHNLQLEAAKSSLLDAKTSIQIALELRQSNEIREVQRNLQQCRDEHAVSVEIAKDTKTMAIGIRTLQEETRLLTTASNTSLDQVVSNTRTILERTTLYDQHSHHADMAAKFTQDAIAGLSIDLRKGLENLPAMLAPMIENTIAKTLTQHNALEWPGVVPIDRTCGDMRTKIRDGSAHNDTYSSPQPKSTEGASQLDQSASSITHINSSLVPTRSAICAEQLMHSAQPLRRSPKRQKTRESIFNVWIGRIEIRTSVTEQEDDVDSRYSLPMCLQARQTTIKLLPSLWFLKTGLLFQSGNSRPTMSHPGWDNRLRVIRTHLDDSPVVKIIQGGDYVAFRQLLERREITPFDLVDTNFGEKSLFELAVQQPYCYPGLNGAHVKGELDIARLLADCGVDCGRGYSLHNVLFSMDATQDNVALILFRVVMTQSKSDPFENSGVFIVRFSAHDKFKLQLLHKQDEWDLSDFTELFRKWWGNGAFQFLVENGEESADLDAWSLLQVQKWQRMPAALRRSKPHCLAEFGKNFVRGEWGDLCWAEERPAFWHSRKACLEEFDKYFVEFSWGQLLGKTCFEFLEGKGAWKQSGLAFEGPLGWRPDIFSVFTSRWSDNKRDKWITLMKGYWSEKEATLRHSRRHCIDQYGTNFVQHELPYLLERDDLAEQEILRLTSYDLDMEPPTPRPSLAYKKRFRRWLGVDLERVSQSEIESEDEYESEDDSESETESEGEYENEDERESRIESASEHDREISDGWETADED